MESVKKHDPLFVNAARCSYRSARGVYRTVRSIKNRLLNLFDVPIIVLIYHRVTKLPSDPEKIAVSPENFYGHMEYLRRKYRVLRFDEDWSEIKERAVVVTFDDGYADNLLEALPILDALQVPATFFASTGLLGTDREFWWHRLEDILLRDGDFPLRVTLEDSRYGQTRDTGSPQQRQKFYATLSLLMRRIESNRRESWLDQLSRWSPPPARGERRHRCMTAEELVKLAQSPWATIGAHTVTHSALSALTEEQQRKEIFSSKQELEKIIAKEVNTFSYPFGRKCEYDRTSVRLCREAGFTRAASNFPGQAHRWTDPYQIPRHLVRNWDVETFAAELQSFWTR